MIPDRQVRPELLPVLRTPESSNTPTVLDWIEREGPRSLLTNLAAASGQVTHATPDAYPAKFVSYLRAALVAHKALPDRDEHLASLITWLSDQLDSVQNPAGRHISAARMGIRLTDLGFFTRAGRSTALMELAAQMPPVVLSKLLGIHVHTATSWSQAAGDTRPGYAAALSRRTKVP